MFDPEFASFYANVKGADWPDVQEYSEFIKLPKKIQDECIQEHQLTNRLTRICDLNYWTGHEIKVYVKGNLAYVPIPKCASNYYQEQFYNLGWQRVPLSEINLETTKLFGLIMHPLKRYLKGVTQFLVASYSDLTPVEPKKNYWLSFNPKINWDSLNRAVESKYFLNLVQNIAVGDQHATPYYFLLGDLMYNIHWIPMDLFDDIELKNKVVEFVCDHGQEINLPNTINRINESSENQNNLYNTIKHLFFKQSHLCVFHKLYGSDLRHYYQVLDQYKQQAN